MSTQPKKRTRKRTRTCYTKAEFKDAVADFIDRGYVLESRNKTSAKLISKQEKKYHGIVALLTIWWSFGLGNLIYSLLPSKRYDEVTILLQSGKNKDDPSIA